MESIWKDKEMEKEIASKQIQFTWYLDAGKRHCLPNMGLFWKDIYTQVCLLLT